MSEFDYRAALLAALHAAARRDGDAMFVALDTLPLDGFHYVTAVAECAFGRALFAVVGQEATYDQLTGVAQILESDSSAVMTPEPYLFERLILRHYGEPDVAAGAELAAVLCHSIVGAAYLAPERPEEVLDAALVEVASEGYAPPN